MTSAESAGFPRFFRIAGFSVNAYKFFLCVGIYIGTPRTEAGPSHQPTDITRVILFKKNLEKICRDRDDLIDQIQITLRHEIGHHLGLSEEDMERLGLA